MTRIPSRTRVLSCLGAKSLLEKMAGFTAGAPTRDVTTLFGQPDKAIAHGTVPIEHRQSDGRFADIDLSELVFFVARLNTDVEYQLFGIDASDRLTLYIEAESEPNSTEIVDVVVLDTPPIVRADSPPAFADLLKKIFFGTINEETENPIVFRCPSGSDLRLSAGIDETTYRDMCERALTIGLDRGSSGAEILVCAATDTDPAHIDTVEPDGHLTPTGYKLVEAVLDVCEPRGWSWEYNDGRNERLSGYTKHPDTLEFEIPPTSAIEKARLMSELGRFLDRHLPANHPVRTEFLARRPTD